MIRNRLFITVSRYIAVFVAVCTLSLVSPVAVYANYFSDQDIELYSPNSCNFGVDTACTCSQGGTPSTISSTISKNIPADWQPIFSGASSKFEVNPNFIAALYLTENGNVWYPLSRTDWASSPVGARGPMQFMPGTWQGYQQDGDNDGVKNIMDIEDSVYAAAALAKGLNTNATTPLGELTQPLTEPSLLRGAAGYNWGGGNVQRAGQDAPLSRLPGETQEYVKNIYTLISTDFTTGGHKNYGPPRLSTGAEGTPTTGTTPTQVCGSGGGIGSVNGVTFPLITTQSAITDTRPTPWCYAKTTNCHHHYNAADIMIATGTTVVAAIGGTVLSANDNARNPSSVGSRVVVKGSDGNIWYYAHMGNNTIAVRPGETISPGQELGKVGTRANAVGTDPHLHIDALPPPYSSRMSCSSAACMKYPFIDIQTALAESFKALPQ